MHGPVRAFVDTSAKFAGGSVQVAAVAGVSDKESNLLDTVTFKMTLDKARE